VAVFWRRHDRERAGAFCLFAVGCARSTPHEAGAF
jgi:hypothetical protein